MHPKFAAQWVGHPGPDSNCEGVAVSYPPFGHLAED